MGKGAGRTLSVSGKETTRCTVPLGVPVQYTQHRLLTRSRPKLHRISACVRACVPVRVMWETSLLPPSTLLLTFLAAAHPNSQPLGLAPVLLAGLGGSGSVGLQRRSSLGSARKAVVHQAR